MMRLIRQERARRAQEAERERVAHDAERIRARCQSLAAFVREAWHVLEPGSEYIHGWHIDAICAHLEAITDGRITRLLINVPPGTMKSLIVSVFWPAWEWGPRGLAWMRYLTTSYSESYVKRDSRRMRDLVQSDWYRSLWPEVSLVRSGEASFANSATGFREGVPFQSLTGGRGHRVLIDDPHSTETAESPAERQRTTRIFRESVPSRLVDPKTSAIVVIMQRLHEEDVSGQCIKLGLGYEHLMLPMEFEPERRCRTSIGFEDPRTYENELLFPERFPREVVDRDKRSRFEPVDEGKHGRRYRIRCMGYNALGQLVGGCGLAGILPVYLFGVCKAFCSLGLTKTEALYKAVYMQPGTRTEEQHIGTVADVAYGYDAIVATLGDGLLYGLFPRSGIEVITLKHDVLQKGDQAAAFWNYAFHMR